MRPVENAHLLKQDNSYAAPLPLTDFRAQLNEQGLNIAPLNVRTRRVREYQFQRAEMSSPHRTDSTIK